MPQVQIADVVVPAEFTAYQVENSMVNTALFQSGVLSRNGAIEAQLQAGAESFTVPFWADLADTEADITNDDPTILSTPQKVTASKQTVRKSFLHQSWSEMSLASELAGSSALERIQSRIESYWNRQFSSRLIASLRGILASDVANNGGSMVNDISGNAGTASQFNGEAVIDTALTMGDHLGDFKAIAMHSIVYGDALKNDEITFFKPSENAIEMPTYKGMAVIIDDELSPVAGVYTSVLLGAGAIGFGASEPNTGFGTEVFRVPAAGNGGGQIVLHRRMNVGPRRLGFIAQMEEESTQSAGR